MISLFLGNLGFELLVHGFDLRFMVFLHILYCRIMFIRKALDSFLFVFFKGSCFIIQLSFVGVFKVCDLFRMVLLKGWKLTWVVLLHLLDLFLVFSLHISSFLFESLSLCIKTLTSNYKISFKFSNFLFIFIFKEFTIFLSLFFKLGNNLFILIFLRSKFWLFLLRHLLL